MNETGAFAFVTAPVMVSSPPHQRSWKSCRLFAGVNRYATTIALVSQATTTLYRQERTGKVIGVSAVLTCHASAVAKRDGRGGCVRRRDRDRISRTTTARS